MTGWLILALTLALALAALRLLGIRGPALTICAAALSLGAAGYALQGSPGLRGASARAGARPQTVPLAEARHAFFGNFTAAESWITMAEALGRAGKTEDSAGLMQNAVRRHPDDPQLWIGLGNALVDHSNGLTPPAELAYRRAAALNPAHPAPMFFYGLALARSGDPTSAIKAWRTILDRAPANASWRPLVEAGIAALSGEEFQADAGK